MFKTISQFKKIKRYAGFVLILVTFSFESFAQTSDSQGVALILNASGVCPEGCADAGAAAATLAGLTPKFVNGKELDSNSTPEAVAAFFENVRVWIMPGGSARNELAGMNARVKTELKAFVQKGGGYVGWCAGAFAATSIVGTTGVSGLGLMAGRSILYPAPGPRNSSGGSIQKTTWFNESRYFYFEGGARFDRLPSSVEVVGRFSDQVSIAAIRAPYGNGRVFLTGTHPEAPAWWWNGTGITDPDGSDLAYAAEMIKWVAKLVE